MKITIDIEFTTEQAKQKYRTHFAMRDKEIVTKSMLSTWFGGLIEGDLDSVHEDESEE